MSEIILIFVKSLRRDDSHKLTGGILQPTPYFPIPNIKKAATHKGTTFFSIKQIKLSTL
jgi:hypothetical protein